MSFNVSRGIADTNEPLLSGRITKLSVSNGIVTVGTDWNQAFDGDLWLGIVQSDALYQTVTVPSNGKKSQSFSIHLSDNVPGRAIDVLCIPMHHSVAEYPQQSFEWRGPELAATKPFAWGVYRDSQDKLHPWHATAGGMMTWDGEPYLPMGGMMNSMFSWPRDEKTSLELARKHLEAQFTLLNKYGIKDIFFNGFFIRNQAEPLAEAVQIAEQYGMRYGLHVTSAPDQGRCAMAFSQDSKGYQVEVDSGEKSAMIRVDLADSYGVTNTRLIWALVSRDNEQRVLETGHAYAVIRAKKRSSDDTNKSPKYTFISKVEFSEIVSENALFICRPELRMRKSDPSGYLDLLDEHIAMIRATYALLKPGPGLRLWIDPFMNEMHSPNYNIPTAESFRRRYAEHLTRVYSNLDALNTHWEVLEQSIPTFEVASRLIPLHENAEAVFCMDPESGQVYTLSAETEQVLHDLTEFKCQLTEEMISTVADVLKGIANVPVILKHNTWLSTMFVNPRRAGGQDGMGFEAYCMGDSLAYHNTLVPLAESLASARHQWSVVTETSAAAFEGQKPYTGYRDRLQMLNSFDLMAMYGAKGVFTFGFSFDHATNGIFQTTNLMRDPRQLEWLATYAKTLRAASDRLKDYVPEVYGWYPVDLHARQLLEREAKPFEMDGQYLASSGMIRMAPDGRWIIPAPNTTMNLHGLFAAFDYLPKAAQETLTTQKLDYPVWLLGEGNDTTNASLRPLNVLTASGIGLVDASQKWMTLDTFRKEYLGYEVFQTVDIDGQTLPDGSLMIWPCTPIPNANVKLPSGAVVTNLQGESVVLNTDEMGKLKLNLQPEPQIRREGNPPDYIGFLADGYYYEDSDQSEVAIIQGVSVQELLGMNPPVWHRWLPSTVVSEDVAAWIEAESPSATNFNVPRVDGYDAYSNFAGIGVMTHWDAPAGERFFARYEVESLRGFSTLWVRKMSSLSMHLEVLIDGRKMGTIAANSSLQDVMHLNPWNAGMGIDDIDVGWVSLDLGESFDAGRHTIELIAIPFIDNERQIDTKLLGGQSEASVEKEAEDQLSQMQGLQLDALLLQ